jgi:VIT1/CCC1 family predicted Fe2+/Mn2+ transporter
MSAQERAHGRVLAAMTDGEQTVGERITRVEGRHRISAGGALRASVFGVNDGLVSNLGLVIGVAGGTDDGGIVMLAGLVGLLAGALSMAGGEWISVQSQRELYQREIAVEAAELEQFPDEERGELVLIYRAKGIPREEADALADQIMERPETALDTLAREELGIDPASLGSPLVAAGSSFLSFALGAVVPVLPFVFSSGGAAVGGALGLSGLGLAGAGAMTSVFTGRSLPRTSLRMVALGAVIAAVTYGLGSVVGVAIE